MTEKKTDFLMMSKFKYNTEHNLELFGQLIPDGWLIDNTKKLLIVIENKSTIRYKKKAQEQLFQYINCISNKYFSTHKIYGVLGFGTTNKNFQSYIYEYILDETTQKFNFVETITKLEDVITIFNLNNDNSLQQKQTKIYDVKMFHDINQYLYDNSINLPKSQKTLFIASILICLKVDSNFVENTLSRKGTTIAQKMLDLIQLEYNDTIFTNQFKFLSTSIHNDKLIEIFRMFEIDLKDVGNNDILNRFYSEFCVWDRNNDAQQGIVLTPDDIVDLMINELNLQSTDCVLDTCTGTGSFLIKSGLYTNNLVGIENNEERYTLAKCNFILNNLDYKNLYYNSCFNQEISLCDKLIINPPFSCDCKDELNLTNTTNWKKFKCEQKFVLYAIQFIKTEGKGAIIIPRCNFNNSIDESLNFKKELLKHIKPLKTILLNSKVFIPNAMTQCTILIFEKIDKIDPINLTDPTNSTNLIDNLYHEIETINYENDGYVIKKNVRQKKSNLLINDKPIIITKNLTYKDDWNYIFDYSNIININETELKKLILTYENEFNYSINKIRINNGLNINFINIINCDKKLKQFNKFIIKDYFIIVKPNKTFQVETSKTGEYPLITRSSLNNGITKFINEYSFDGENQQFITVAPSGSTGATFYHKYKFAVDNIIKTLTPLIKMTEEQINIWTIMMNYQFTKKYSYTNGLSINKLLNEEIYIPEIE